MQKTLNSNLATLAETFGGPLKAPMRRVFKAIGIDARMAVVVEHDMSFNITSYDRAVQAFSNAWPEYLPWPEGIERPEPEQSTEARTPVAAE